MSAVLATPILGSMNKINVAIIGATGLVGSLLLERLAQSNDVQSIKAITRKPLTKVPYKTENIVIDFNRMQEYAHEITADVFICCLGTTIKAAGTQDAFHRVDYDYVIQFAKIAEQNHAKKFQVVSAMGADASSSVFYNRTKGEMEKKLKELKIPQIEIFQPSLILGERKDKRAFEDIAQNLAPKLNFLFKGPLEKYRPIKATDIAAAMAKTSLQSKAGQFTYSSNQIQNLAAGKPT